MSEDCRGTRYLALPGKLGEGLKCLARWAPEFYRPGMSMQNKAFERHGAFSWCELMTTDVQAAKQFYGSLFGWQMEVKNVTGTPYTVVSADGVGVGGIMAMPPDMSGIPPHWGVYVTVDDVDATAKRVEELGGSVCLPPTDIPTVGRICVFRDPQGAPMTVITYLKACE